MGNAESASDDYLRVEYYDEEANTLKDDVVKVHWNKVLGNGGFGKVYQGTLLAANRVVAVKTSRQYSGFLESAARKLRGVRCSNLCRLYAIKRASVCSNVCYVVEEACLGRDLYSYMSEMYREKLPGEAVARSVVKAVLGALRGLHEIGWVHGDVKFENLMFPAPAERLSALKLIDVEAASPAKHLRGTEAIACTPEYLGPEVLDGIFTPATDIRAVGCLCYAMMEGRLPFPDNLLTTPTTSSTATTTTTTLAPTNGRSCSSDSSTSQRRKYHSGPNLVGSPFLSCSDSDSEVVLFPSCFSPSSPSTPSSPPSTPRRFSMSDAVCAHIKRRLREPRAFPRRKEYSVACLDFMQRCLEDNHLRRIANAHEAFTHPWLDSQRLHKRQRGRAEVPREESLRHLSVVDDMEGIVR